MWQLWILDTKRFEKVGPPQNAVEGNLWLQVLGRHFGCGVELRPVPSALPQGGLRSACVVARSVWPGEAR